MQHHYHFPKMLRFAFPWLAAWLLMASITLAQPVLVKDINPGAANSNPALLVNTGNTIFLVADDGSTGRELWKSDGTPEGTRLVKDITPGASGSSPHNLTNVDGTLFFLANRNSAGVTLWKSDGTEAGTVVVREFALPGDYSLRDFTNVNGTLFFVNYENTSGMELWKSDGTMEGTVLVKDINPGPRWSAPSGLVNYNGTLYFVADNGTNGRELWRSDGTESGTTLVKDINPGVANGFSPLLSPNLNVVNGLILFPANDGISGLELWKSDGTTEGTELLNDLTPGAGSSVFSRLASTDNALFWSVNVSYREQLLYKSDGTPAGTGLVRAFGPPRPGPTIGLTGLTSAGNLVYFTTSIYSPSFGKEERLWRSDGTDSGTTTVQTLASYYDTSPTLIFTILKNVNGVLYYTAFDSRVGSQLRRSSGSGSVLVTDINQGLTSVSIATLTYINGTLYYAATNAATGNELYKYTLTPPFTALRLNAGGPAYKALDSRTFEADNYVTGGNTYIVSEEVASTDDDELYRTERWGEFSYGLLTGKGTFRVTLHFAETYWGNIAEGGVGSRRFNVDIEGTRQLTEYDIAAEAGVLTAVQKTFTVTVTDDTLNLDFIKGSADWPKVSAIEVTSPAPTARLANTASHTEEKMKASAAVYPNPATHRLVVTLSEPADRVATQVADVTGRTRLQNAHRAVAQNQLEMNVAALPSGVYLLRLQTKQGTQVLRFVKQ